MKYAFTRNAGPDEMDIHVEWLWDQVVDMPWIASSLVNRAADPTHYAVTDGKGIQYEKRDGFPVFGCVAFDMPQWWDGVKRDAVFSVAFDSDERGHYVVGVNVTRGS